MSLRVLLQSVLLFVVAMGVLGCDTQSPSEETIAEVVEVLKQREKAIESKDLELYKTLIYSEYSEKGLFYDDIVEDLETLFSVEGDIRYEYQKARPSITMNSSRVIHMVEYHFAGSGKVKKFQEKLYLRKVNGTWLISGGMPLAVYR